MSIISAMKDKIEGATRKVSIISAMKDKIEGATRKVSIISAMKDKKEGDTRKVSIISAMKDKEVVFNYLSLVRHCVFIYRFMSTIFYKLEGLIGPLLVTMFFKKN
ncbi:hypothetical protein [Gracilibacillus saliphilus]|uniref:hypothetical protein n=1 Tax=Gracilibacillus saliphilus TaxID=543890 RepID=UPI0013D1EC91|nr:hypothetical protein [Gracilibacillus saliphilus]